MSILKTKTIAEVQRELAIHWSAIRNLTYDVSNQDIIDALGGAAKLGNVETLKKLADNGLPTKDIGDRTDNSDRNGFIYVQHNNYTDSSVERGNAFTLLYITKNGEKLDGKLRSEVIVIGINKNNEFVVISPIIQYDYITVLGTFNNWDEANTFLNKLDKDKYGRFVIYVDGNELLLTITKINTTKSCMTLEGGSFEIGNNTTSLNDDANITIYRYNKINPTDDLKWGIWSTIDSWKQQDMNGNDNYNHIYSNGKDNSSKCVITSNFWFYVHNNGDVFLRFKRWGQDDEHVNITNDINAQNGFSQQKIPTAWVGSNGLLRADVYRRLDKFNLSEHGSTTEDVNIAVPIFTTNGSRNFTISKATSAKAGVMTAEHYNIVSKFKNAVINYENDYYKTATGERVIETLSDVIGEEKTLSEFNNAPLTTPDQKSNIINLYKTKGAYGTDITKYMLWFGYEDESPKKLWKYDFKSIAGFDPSLSTDNPKLFFLTNNFLYDVHVNKISGNYVFELMTSTPYVYSVKERNDLIQHNNSVVESISANSVAIENLTFNKADKIIANSSTDGLMSSSYVSSLHSIENNTNFIKGTILLVHANTMSNSSDNGVYCVYTNITGSTIYGVLVISQYGESGNVMQSLYGPFYITSTGSVSPLVDNSNEGFTIIYRKYLNGNWTKWEYIQNSFLKTKENNGDNWTWGHSVLDNILSNRIKFNEGVATRYLTNPGLKVIFRTLTDNVNFEEVEPGYYNNATLRNYTPNLSISNIYYSFNAKDYYNKPNNLQNSYIASFWFGGKNSDGSYYKYNSNSVIDVDEDKLFNNFLDNGTGGPLLNVLTNNGLYGISCNYIVDSNGNYIKPTPEIKKLPDSTLYLNYSFADKLKLDSLLIKSTNITEQESKINNNSTTLETISLYNDSDFLSVNPSENEVQTEITKLQTAYNYLFNDYTKLYNRTKRLIDDNNSTQNILYKLIHKDEKPKTIHTVTTKPLEQSNILFICTSTPTEKPLFNVMEGTNLSLDYTSLINPILQVMIYDLNDNCIYETTGGSYSNNFLSFDLTSYNNDLNGNGFHGYCYIGGGINMSIEDIKNNKNYAGKIYVSYCTNKQIDDDVTNRMKYDWSTDNTPIFELGNYLVQGNGGWAYDDKQYNFVLGSKLYVEDNVPLPTIEAASYTNIYQNIAYYKLKEATLSNIDNKFVSLDASYVCKPNEIIYKGCSMTKYKIFVPKNSISYLKADFVMSGIHKVDVKKFMSDETINKWGQIINDNKL